MLGIPVGEMLTRMTSSEISEYMAYDRISPFGEERADLRAGIVASAVVNHSMSPPKRPSKPSDFMPFVKSAGPLLLADPVKHGQLIAGSLFGDNVRKIR